MLLHNKVSHRCWNSYCTLMDDIRYRLNKKAEKTLIGEIE